ncbi:hypothetical protein ABW20_dc0101837 [Dactylellina cionopaga]|nr:hypothetical protein ABW20_dc0101837 [Dactylellina cionopaga]
MNEVLTNGSRPSPTPSNPSSTRNLGPAIELPNATTASEIRCFCGYDQDDGFTIQCDKCSHWQHGICVKINPKNVPETFICYYCEIRDLHQTDVKKARDIQAKRIEAEGRKTQVQPKRSTGANNRKRETNGSGHARNHSESISHKPQSPKEHATGGKSRGRQRPISTQAHSNLPDTSASPDEHSPNGKSPSVEREVSADSEIPASIYTKEYSPISCNTIVSPEVDHKIKIWTHVALDGTRNAIATADSSLPCTPRQYSTSDFEQLIPSGHTVRWVSSPEELSSLGLPLIRLVADTPSKADQFVIEYVGEIGSKTSYIQDPLNQYQRIRHPKAFVLFHPQLPIYLDARRCGSEARFVRRSCRPNLKFETMIIDGTDLRFALYTNQPIERGAELTIGWEWDSSLPFTQLLNGNSSPEDLDPELLQKMSTWAEVITTTVGECACADRESCVMARLKGDVAVGKPKKSSKPGTKRRWREMQDSNPTETINLIEKLTNPDSHNRSKRVKRSGLPQQPSAQLAIPSGTPDVTERTPKPSSDQTLASTSQSGQASVLPDSLQSSQGNAKTLLVNGTSAPQARPKVSYVDGGVQTDADTIAYLPTLSLPTSRKMRILAQFRAQSQQNDKGLKKQLSIVKEEESPPREIKSEADRDVVMMDINHTAQASPPVKPIVIDVKLSHLEAPSDPTIKFPHQIPLANDLNATVNSNVFQRACVALNIKTAASDTFRRIHRVAGVSISASYSKYPSASYHSSIIFTNPDSFSRPQNQNY